MATFLRATQLEVAEALDLGNDSPTRRQFLARLQGQISKRGTIDVIRKRLEARAASTLTCSMGRLRRRTLKAQELYRLNRFSVTRQLRYSQDQTALSLDLCLFINGLPIATFELKNSLTKQTVDDAVEQYKRDRNPRERLFELGRCLAHFRGGRARGEVLHAATRARPRGSCRSTRAGTTGRATRRTRTA